MGELGHVLWIGGSSGSGKTTVARLLARRHGLRWYNSDAHTWAHRDRAIAAGNPAALRFEALSPAERAGLSAEQSIALSLHVERGPLTVADMYALPTSPLIVAEGTQVQCALVITALNSSFMKNDAQQQGDNVVLVGTDDRDMTTVAKDSRGQNVYSYGEIPAGTYPKIQPSGAVYGTKAIGTIQVDAIFVANADWINAHESDYDKLLRSFAAAKPQIAKLAQPQ